MINFAFRDIFVAMAAIFLMIALLPVGEDSDKKNDGQIQSQGQLVVMMTWPPNIDRDIDLWVKHPMKPNAVGWSNKGDRECNLLRDDLGAREEIDPIQVNFEQTTCRKLQIGEYIVNVHFYGGTGEEQVIPVEVEIRTVDNGSSTQIDKFSSVLKGKGDWETMSRFVVDEEGYVVDKPSRTPYPMHLEDERR